MLASLRVVLITGRVPPDLGRRALARLASACARRSLRDEYLQEAASLAPGTLRRKLRALEAALRGPTASPAVARYVTATREVDPALPRRSRRMLLRLLTRGRTVFGRLYGRVILDADYAQWRRTTRCKRSSSWGT